MRGKNKKYNELIGKGEIEKVATSFNSRFGQYKTLFISVSIIIIFFVLPTFGIFNPSQFLIKLIFDGMQVPVLGGIIGALIFVLIWIAKIFMFICAAIGLCILAFVVLFLPSGLALSLFLKTAELSDRYTHLPKFRGREPINKKLGIALYILFSFFITSSLFGLIHSVFLKIIGVIYGFWAIQIFVDWLSLQSKK